VLKLTKGKWGFVVHCIVHRWMLAWGFSKRQQKPTKASWSLAGVAKS